MDEMLDDGVSWSGRERNCAFLNTGGERFADVSALSGLDFADDGRAVATVDWDHDGDLDLWIVNRTGPQARFMRNTTSRAEHAVSLRLVGKTVNRDAIGARVELAVDGRPRRVQTVTAGGGFLCQSSKWTHFGLTGEISSARIIVKWPGGEKETFTGVDRRGRYVLEEGSGMARRSSEQERAVALDDAAVAEDDEDGAIRVALSIKADVPRYTGFVDADGRRRFLDQLERKSTLLVLGADWCAACRKELSGLRRERPRLDAAGVNVVALEVPNTEHAESQATAGPSKMFVDLPVPKWAARPRRVVAIGTDSRRRVERWTSAGTADESANRRAGEGQRALRRCRRCRDGDRRRDTGQRGPCSDARVGRTVGRAVETGDRTDRRAH